METLLLNHFESGDLHFRIPGPIFDTDTDFQLNLTISKFYWGGAWVWSRGTFSDLGTSIFEFLSEFYQLVSIFGPIQRLFIFRGGASGCGHFLKHFGSQDLDF